MVNPVNQYVGEHEQRQCVNPVYITAMNRDNKRITGRENVGIGGQHIRASGSSYV